MFDKIDSIMARVSFFANEAGVNDMSKGVELNGIQENMNILDKMLKNRGDKNEKRQSN
jgi:N-acetyl-anhydromuramyl-L-alanine amidase AmpD